MSPLISPHLFIGQLLEDLSKQSGVKLAAGDNDGSGYPQVMIAVRNAPIGDVLASLCSLVSYQKAEWEWTRSGDAGNYTYQLTQPTAARTLAAHWRAEVQKEFQDQTQEMLDALKMSPDELNAATKDNPLLSSIADGKDNRVKPSFQIIADSLTPDVMDTVFQGQKSVQIPLSQLAPAGQAFAASQWQFQLDHDVRKPLPDGSFAPMIEPQTVTIESSRTSNDVAPTLYLDLGYGSGGLSGGAWMEKEWERKTDDLWMLPGDTLDAAQMAHVTQSKATARTTAAEHEFSGLTRKIAHLAAGAEVNVIARLPQNQNFGSADAQNQPEGKSVAAFLKDAQNDMPYLHHKWHSNVLLLTYPAWFEYETPDTVVPWTVVKSLRTREAAEGGYLSLADWEFAVQHLNQGQMKELGGWVPMMQSVAACHDLLLQMARSPNLAARLTSPTGVPAGDVVDSLKSFLPVDQSYQDGTLQRVKIVDGFNTDITPNQKDISIQAIDVKGNFVAGIDLVYPKNVMEWDDSSQTH